MSKLFLLVLIMSCSYNISAQVRRSYQYEGMQIEVLAQNNRIANSFSFPGMNTFIIVGDSSKTLNEIYATDKLLQMPVKGINDYACFYYVNVGHLMHDSSLKKFLKGFIDWCYEADYINRNSVQLLWYVNRTTITCRGFASIDSIVSGIHVMSGSNSSDCNVFFASTPAFIWQKSLTATTLIKYKIPGLIEMEEKEAIEQRQANLESYSKTKGNVFLQFSVGSHHINSRNKTSFDTSTLVDFTKHKTLWNINAGYYFTHRLFANIDIAFIYSGKQKNISDIDWGDNGGVTVKGSGYAGAILRYGGGIGWVAYRKKRLDILLTCNTGKLKAIAGGGNATRTIGGGNGNTNNTNIVKRTEQSSYNNLTAGVNYRSGNTFFFTGSFQYCISNFKQAIGSVTAFTGWSINVGIGVAIPTKKNKDD